jgi:hypothetical protein
MLVLSQRMDTEAFQQLREDATRFREDYELIASELNRLIMRQYEVSNLSRIGAPAGE